MIIDQAAMLAIIALFILAALSLLWTTIRTGITPMPSSLSVRLTMLRLGDIDVDAPIIELGSGWGGMLLMLARQYPERRIIAYELSWLPWLWSRFLVTVLRMRNVKVYRRDFLTAPLPALVICYCYLCPSLMQKLAQKLAHSPCDGMVLISSTFALPGFEPEEQLMLNDFHATPIYRYRIANGDALS